MQTRGLEWACTSTAETFSPADHTHWSRQLHSAYRADLEGKEKALQGLRYSTASVSRVLSIWERIPEDVTGMWYYGGGEGPGR